MKGWLLKAQAEDPESSGKVEQWYDDAVAVGVSVTNILMAVRKDVDIEIQVMRSENPDACEAVLHHGPGHQSKTRCQVEGEHTVHKAVFGNLRREATWRDGSYRDRLIANGTDVPDWVDAGTAMTGFFDEPPEEEE